MAVDRANSTKRAAMSLSMARQFIALEATRRINLGSGLIDQSQKITVAAMQIADMKVWAQRS